MKAEAIVDSEGSGSFTLEGTEPRPLAVGSESAAVGEVLRLAVAAAASAAEPVELTAHLPGRVDVLLVSPSGAIERIERPAPESAPLIQMPEWTAPREEATAPEPAPETLRRSEIPPVEISAPEPTPAAAAPARRRRPGGAVLGIAGASLTGVLLAGGLGYVVLNAAGADDSSSTAMPTATARPTIYIPATVPSPWTQTASWAGDLAENTYPVVTTDGYVAHIAPDHTVHVTAPGTGKALLSSSSTKAPTSLVAFIEPTAGVAWLADGELHTWSRKAGEKTYAAQDGARLYGGGSAPMLWKQGSTTVTGLVDGKAVDTVIPDGTTPLGITEGTVVSSAGSPPLWLTPLAGGAPTSVPLGGPDDAERQVRRWIGMEGDRVLIAWSVPGHPDTTTVRLHDARTGKVLASADAPWAKVEKAVLVGSAGKRHPAFGPVFVDDTQMLLARNHDVAALGTTAARYGLIGQTVGLIDAAGEWTAFPDGTKVPMGLGPDGEAIIRTGNRVYALPAK